MLDNDSKVLEKCNFVHEKSLKSPWISFLKKCGNHVPIIGSPGLAHCIENPVLADGFASQQDNGAESVYMSWRHQGRLKSWIQMTLIPYNMRVITSTTLSIHTFQYLYGG